MKLKKRFSSVAALLFCLSAAAQSSYSLCSFNVRVQNAKDKQNQWEARKDSVIAMLRQYDFDIFGLQEDQVNFHLKDLSVMSDVYRSYSGPARPQYNASGNTIFYKHRKFVLMAAGTFWLSVTPDVPYTIGWDAMKIRNCNWVRLYDITNGNVLYVFNAHMDHIGSTARAEGAKLILRRVKEIVGDYPAFVMGDFNEEPDKDGVRVFSSVLYDTALMALSKEGPNETFPNWERDRTRRIDYIFTNMKDMRILEYVTSARYFDMYGLYRMYPSDHYPVYIRFEM